MDPVNNPSHYKQGKIEVIDFIEDQKFDYHIGNAIKYICRHGHKGNPVQDLEKAIWYLKRKISLISKPLSVLPLAEFPNTEKVPFKKENVIEEKETKQSVAIIYDTASNTVIQTEDFNNHTLETCMWGGCFKCDPIGHKL